MSDAVAGSVPPGDGAPAQGRRETRPEGTHPPLLNIANLLTALRLILVPVFVLALVAARDDSTIWRLIAAVLFLAASITDFYDGKIARARDLVTPFGAIADPIADKALTGAALIGLSWLNLLPWWVTIAIIARELGVTVLRFWVIRHGVIAASRGGKLKTLLQIIAIIWMLVPVSGLLAWPGRILMGAALIVTVVTGGDYLFRALALRRNAREEQ
jgi:CDP-diacylglycerol--glycerol-3-phosphate 3-phosphatidyltransferase